MVIARELTEGHAPRAARRPATPTAARNPRRQGGARRLSVRQTEALVRSARKGESGAGSAEDREKQKAAKSANLRDLEQRLTQHLGLRVQIEDEGNKGRVVVHYGNLEDFDQLLERFGDGLSAAGRAMALATCRPS